MIPNAKRVYALRGYTVELRSRGWFYKTTYEDGVWHGPYSSGPSVTLMIARQLLKEIIRRDAPHELPN